MINDVGEHIPYSKKELAGYQNSPDTLTPMPKPSNNGAIKLSDVWPEPNWVDMFLDGMQAEVLAHIYSIYHSLAQKPHTAEGISFSKVRITLDMWESAYEETVRFIRDACENAISISFADELSDTFKEAFSINGEPSFRTYAAGKKTERTFFHPLGSTGKAGAYRKILPLLDWPLGVVASKIPFFPIELKNKETKVISYSLGTLHKKSVAWHGDKYGYENKFKTYEEAVAALVAFHGKDFTIAENKRKAVPPYTPRKNIVLTNDVVELPNKTPDDLMRVYGFRGLQFGNYLPQKERQNYINVTYHALGLLSSLLTMPDHWIGGRRLGLSFGARGSGNAAAHYELSEHVINLTRFNGFGAIAHEVWHSVDARVASKWFNKTGLLSNLLVNRTARHSDVEPKYKARAMAFFELVDACTCDSDFVNNARRLEKQKGAATYWTKPTELCARAFEAYIQDKLEARGTTRQWLSLGTKERDYVNNGMHPYPTGADRQRINAVMDKCIPVIFGKF